jgi:hypothetical protein
VIEYSSSSGAHVNFFAIAGLVVAILGLPAVWIAWRTNRAANKAINFDGVQEYVESHQPDLRSLAWSTSSSAWRSDTIPLLARPGWLRDKPMPLDRVILKWQPNATVESINSRRRMHRSRAESFGGYPTYSKALVTRPGKGQLFNGFVYRPISIEVAEGDLQITFTKGRYFDYLDSSEVLAYELGARMLAQKSDPAGGTRRRSVADPFDLASRPTSLGINTLTIRKDINGTHGFFMHRRNGPNVVNESDLIHVVPAGEFTPSDIGYEAIAADFSIWRNIMREYAEEFLGNEEAYGRGGQPIDYDNAFPYAELSAALRDEGIHVNVLGVAIDALCLKPELLTVCVLDAAIFDHIFKNMVSVDNEGVLLVGSSRHGIPFTGSNVDLYADNADTSSAGAACLKLAWQYRRELGLEPHELA